MTEKPLSKEQHRKQAILDDLKRVEDTLRVASSYRVQLLEQLHELEFKEYVRALNV